MPEPTAPSAPTSVETSPQPVPPESPAPSAPGPQPSRLSFDPAHSRRGAVDGGWWPESRNATAELPGLIAALGTQPGVHVHRVAVHGDDWDDIPRRLPAGGSHVVRVDWFTTIPRHTVSVSADDHDTINLLVIPPDTAAAPAQAALDTAMTGQGDPADILTGGQQAPAQRPAT